MFKKLAIFTLAVTLSGVLAVSSLQAGKTQMETTKNAQMETKGEHSGKEMTQSIVVVFAPPTKEEASSLSKSLNLTPEQKQKMQGLNQKYAQQAKAMKDEYIRAVRDLTKLMVDPNITAQGSNQELKHFHQVHQTILDQEVAYWSDFKTILTPQQNKIFGQAFTRSRLQH